MYYTRIRPGIFLLVIVAVGLSSLSWLASPRLGLGGGPGAQNEPIPFTADRPFIYFIYDRMTGTILFVGRVLNPGAE